MLDVIGRLLAPSLVQMPDVIIEFLHILSLQVCVTFLLLILYNFYMENTADKSKFFFFFFLLSRMLLALSLMLFYITFNGETGRALEYLNHSRR